MYGYKINLYSLVNLCCLRVVTVVYRKQHNICLYIFYLPYSSKYMLYNVHLFCIQLYYLILKHNIIKNTRKFYFILRISLRLWQQTHLTGAFTRIHLTSRDLSIGSLEWLDQEDKFTIEKSPGLFFPVQFAVINGLWAVA